MSSGNIRLTRRDHQTSLAGIIQEETEFQDVSLACEDQQVGAHKVVLAASSLKLRHILLSNPHPQPLIYLSGLKFSDLENILRFIYHGEVDISPDQLNSFMEVAKELQVKGLTDFSTTISRNRENVAISSVGKQMIKPTATTKEYIEEYMEEEEEEEDVKPIIENIKTEAEEDEEDEDGALEAEERDIAVRGKSICPHCKKRKKSSADLEKHIIRRHTKKKHFSCLHCSKKFSGNQQLKDHIKAVHLRERPFCCPYCSRTFSLNHHLKDHFCSFQLN